MRATVHSLRILFIALLVAACAAGCGEPRKGDPLSIPHAAFVARSLVPDGALVLFDGSHSKDYSGYSSEGDLLPGLIMSYAYDWGEEEAPVEVSFSPKLEHRFAGPGEHIVSLTVTDDLGNQGFIFHPIVVVPLSDYVPCASHGDCASGSVCSAQQCRIRVPECLVDEDCIASNACGEDRVCQ